LSPNDASDSVLIDVGAVVATRGRAKVLRRTLESLSKQSAQPFRIAIVDASEDVETKKICEKSIARLRSEVEWVHTKSKGAASQRNEGIAKSSEPVILFFDDDVLFEHDCLARLWNALQSDSQLGGVSAMITNQSYSNPSAVSRLVFTLLHGRKETSFAGKVIGPAVNLLPQDKDDLPEIVPVEWLNTTCTMYRREALPSPGFDSFFKNYSLMEDVTLSLRVAQRGWRLANVRTARIYHDSQPGEHKSDMTEIAAMELVNRYYVMRNVLGLRGLGIHLKLILWLLFQLASKAAGPRPWQATKSEIAGKFRAIREIRSSR
jgi:GT2 family glycosyltransferase